MKIIKKIAKIIRVITIAPIIALILINILFFLQPQTFNGWYDYCFALLTLVIFPLLGYPVQWIFKVIKGDRRKAERKLAVIFSIIGYIAGTAFAFLFNVSNIEKVMYLTYLLSGMLIGIFTFVFKIDASGHMCGVTGPVALIVYVFGRQYLLLLLSLILVIWSSMYLKRHTVKQLIYGTIIPIIALLIAVFATASYM